MQQRQGARITHPLGANEQVNDRRAPEQGTGSARNTEDLSELAGTPTVTIPSVRPDQGTARPPAEASAALLQSDELELRRIREILVGPYLRDHERRLRAIERQGAGASKAGDPALERTLQMLMDERQALRAELARERQTREDVADRHARAISELAKTLDQERTAHARMHALHAAELDARLEHERQARAGEIDDRLVRERQAHLQNLDARMERIRELYARNLDARLERERQDHAAELRRLQSAHESQIASLQQLVADAERALVAMQTERQYLAGLLAELGLHLVRHAASPAAADAEQTSMTLLKATARSERTLGR